jgi:tetratricopeptide (TPR) repeat protein
MKVHPLTWAALAALFAAVLGLQLLQAKRQPLGLRAGESANLLYVQSPAVLRRAALSYDALIADVYWLRTVQHYGGTKLSTDPNRRYDILYPLLDLTTSLDPYFDIAYRFGSVFLADAFPSGAGRPDQAVALLQKGLRLQPGKWEFAQELGFVYYFWYQDYDQAAAWFNRAADMPTAPNWLRPLAAVTLAEGGKRSTSRALWDEIVQNADSEWLRQQAQFRLQQLDAMDAMDAIGRVVEQFHARAGRYPASWAELVRAGVLRGIPVDARGTPFALDPSTGRVTLDPQSALNPLPTSERSR